MSRWQQLYNNMNFQTVIDEILDSLNNINTENNELLQEKNRLKKVVEYIETCLKSLDYHFLTSDIVNNINSDILPPLTSINDEINAFKNVNNIENLKTANSHGDNLLNKRTILQFNINSNSARIIGQSARRLSDEVEDYLKNLDDKVESFYDEHKDFDSTINDFKTQITSLEARVKETHNTFMEDFENSQNKKDQEFKELLNTFNTDAQKIIFNMNENLKKAENILGISSNTAQTGHYMKYANSENKQAKIFRTTALVLMIFISYVIYNIIINGNLSWEYSIVKIVTTSILLVPAWYAAKEASKHSKMERIYRKKQLELATFDPFLESLDIDEKNSIKKEISSKFFGETEIIDDKNEPVTAGSLFDLIEKVLLMLAKKN